MQHPLEQFTFFEPAVDPDQRVADLQRSVDVRARHQFVQPDQRRLHQFLLVDILRTVGIEIHTRLQQVEPRKVTDPVAGFDDPQPLFRQRDGVKKIFQPDFLLYVIVIFGGQSRYEILDSDPRIDFAETAQFLQSLVIGLHPESVEKRPAEVESRVYRLVVNSGNAAAFSFGAFGAVFAQGARITGRQVERRQAAGIGRRHVVRGDLLFVFRNADRVVLLESLLQAGLQRVGLLCRQHSAQTSRCDRQNVFSHACFFNRFVET